MKKSLFIISVLCFCFGLIACDNSTQSGNDDSITANQLIEKMPVSFAEFEKQASGARAVRTASTVNPETLEDIKPQEYNSWNDDEFSYATLFLTVLKNDVIKSESLEFDENIDISSVVPDSEATSAYLKTIGNYTYKDLFPDLGTIKVSYDDDKVELYWSLILRTQREFDIVLYITGTFSDDIYADFTTAVNIRGDAGSINFEGYKINGNKSILENALYNSNGSCRTIYQEKEGSSYVRYFVGHDSFNSSVSAADLAKYAQYRKVCIKNSEYAASFINDDPSYNVYDTTGNLLFTERKDGSEYKQIIPLKYIRSSNSNEIAVDHEETFRVRGNQDKAYPCYVMTSNSASQIILTVPFSFVKKDLSLKAIAKLDEYYAQSNAQEFLSKLTTKEATNTLQKKIDEWVKTISK